MGPVVRIPLGGRIAAGQRTMHLRANSKIVHPRYLFYLLISPEIQSQLMALAMGTTVPHLRVADVKSFVLPSLPPMDTQTAVQELLGALDDKIAINDRIIQAAYGLAEAWYRKLASDANQTESVGNLLELKYGKALPAADRMEGSVPVYGSGGIAGNHDKGLVEGPGIVIGRKGTVGAVYWSEKSFFPIDTTFYVELRRKDVSMEFAFYMLKSLGLEGMNSDSAVPGLNRTNALALEVGVPGKTELGIFHETVRPLFALREARSAESASLAKLRDTLLPKLMSGEIRVRDAEKVVEKVT